MSLDGTLIAIDRVATRDDKIATAGTLASTKPRALTTRSPLASPGYPSGRPRWHSAACTTLLPPANTALGRCMPPRPPVCRPWPTLADKSYKGAGIGVHSPVKGANLPVSDANYNTLLTAMRALVERANAELRQRSKCLRRIRLYPNRIGDIVAAGIVLSTLQRGTY